MVFIKAKVASLQILIVMVLLLLPIQVFSMTLTATELGEQSGLYLGSAYAYKSLSHKQCADVITVPDRYQESENFIYKQLIKRKFANKEVRSMINNPQFQALLSHNETKYIDMLNHLEEQFGHPVACGMILGTLQGIMQASSRVIEKTTITKK